MDLKRISGAKCSADKEIFGPIMEDVEYSKLIRLYIFHCGWRVFALLGEKCINDDEAYFSRYQGLHNS
jgi:hypothetical protein